MRLPTRTRYALRMTLDIARHSEEGQRVSLARVAERCGLSRGYLEQLAAALRAAGIVRGTPGRRGGYRLARPAEEITVKDIVDATMGPVSVVPCVSDPGSCPRSRGCEPRTIYTLINTRIVDVLAGCTVADLVDPEWLCGFDALGEAEVAPTPRPRARKSSRPRG